MNNKQLKFLRKTLLFIAILASTLGSVYMYFKGAKMISLCFLISSSLLFLNIKK